MSHKYFVFVLDHDEDRAEEYNFELPQRDDETIIRIAERMVDTNPEEVSVFYQGPDYDITAPDWAEKFDAGWLYLWENAA